MGIEHWSEATFVIFKRERYHIISLIIGVEERRGIGNCRIKEVGR